MDEAKRDLVQRWLIKAQRDLGTARKAASDPDPYFDTAIYHCQQAAEKAIKGFLVFRDQVFEKTHDIGLLLNLAICYDEGFSMWLDAGDRLTPYGIEFRYPGEVLEPDRDDFDWAQRAAEGIYDFVLSLLPRETHPAGV